MYLPNFGFLCSIGLLMKINYIKRLSNKQKKCSCTNRQKWRSILDFDNPGTTLTTVSAQATDTVTGLTGIQICCSEHLEDLFTEF